MARKKKAVETSGFLNIDKPPGWTSHDVVARVRRLVGERQVGHAGTLDPAATGVLPVAVGHATRVLPYIEDSAKTYVATIRFGIATDSGDRDGRLLSAKPAGHLTVEQVTLVLSRFLGVQQQQPPRQSAIKVGGQRLHQLARRGIDVEVPWREVQVHACELVSWDAPDAVVRIACSKGTYIRSIARDAGATLGCGAVLTNLVRVAAGGFHLSESMAMRDLEPHLAQYGWEWIAMHPDVAMCGMPLVHLDDSALAGWFNGQAVRQHFAHAGDARVYDGEGTWIGVGYVDAEERSLHPRRVIRESATP